MPRPRFARLDAEKQDTILDAAEEEFVSLGFEKASFNRIIAAAGVSKGAMYYYFDDKEDLFMTVLGRRLGPLAEALGELGPVDDVEGFWRAVAAMFQRAFTFLAGDPAAVALARTVAAGFSKARSLPALEPIFEAARARTAEVLAAGEAVGAVRTDLPRGLLVEISLGIGEASDVWMAQHWEELDPQTLRALPTAVIDLFRRVCAPTQI